MKKKYIYPSIIFYFFVFLLNAQAPSVSFPIFNFGFVNEPYPNPTNYAINVTLSGYTGANVTVDILIDGGSAESSDYNLVTTSLIFDSNESLPVVISILPDEASDEDSDETIRLRLSVADGSSADLGTSTFTITITENTTLPIELTAFSGKRIGSAIELHWRTASERDNAYMEVQRSKDGKRFEALQQVLSKTGGNSYTPQGYTFTDEKPLPGVNYYRLRQVDFDGKEEYHNIIAVLFQDKDFDKNITIFPTIVKDQVNIALAQEADSEGELYISDLNGQVLLRQPFERGMQQYTLELPQLAQGAYILSVKTGRELLSTRFVKN
ncbi:MAG: T9SS type A sorting domain-containing protein [Saprospiraceae bacterium]|nr:T9SS type A sorting domain-containing protein [Saprospiraceae bacterium]